MRKDRKRNYLRVPREVLPDGSRVTMINLGSGSTYFGNHESLTRNNNKVPNMILKQANQQRFSDVIYKTNQYTFR